MKLFKYIILTCIMGLIITGSAFAKENPVDPMSVANHFVGNLILNSYNPTVACSDITPKLVQACIKNYNKISLVNRPTQYKTIAAELVQSKGQYYILVQFSIVAVNGQKFNFVMILQQANKRYYVMGMTQGTLPTQKTTPKKK